MEQHSYTKEQENYIKYLLSIEECDFDTLFKLYNCHFTNDRRTKQALSSKIKRIRKANKKDPN